MQATFLILEGVCIFIFAEMSNLAASIIMLTICSFFVQGAQGTTYGIVPYVNSASPGAVMGIVGAGGPMGAVTFGLIFRCVRAFRRVTRVLLSVSSARPLLLIFRSLPDDPNLAIRSMAGIVLASSVLCAAITIKGHRGLLFGKETDHTAIQVPVVLL